MSETNGVGPNRLDLSEYALEPIPFKFGDLEFSIPNDLPLAAALRAEKVMARVGDLKADEVDEDKAREVENAVWALATEFTSRAEPPLPKPIRELISLGGAMALLGFLQGKLATTTPSSSPLALPTPTAARSASRNSSARGGSRRRPSG